MHEPNNYCSNLESDLWEQGFTTFPVNSDGKSGFLSGITGYEGSPPSDENRATWKKEFPFRNIGITGYLHKNGVRDETQFMLILDDDDETGEATKDLEDAIGEELTATVSVSGRGQSNPRKKTLYIVDGHRLRLPSKIMDGRIDIISDVQRLIVIGGTHLGTGLPIQIYGPDGEVLDRPLKVTDLARAPQALVEFLKSQVGNDFGPRETDENLTVDNFMACLDDREQATYFELAATVLIPELGASNWRDEIGRETYGRDELKFDATTPEETGQYFDECSKTGKCDGFRYFGASLAHELLVTTFGIDTYLNWNLAIAERLPDFFWQGMDEESMQKGNEGFETAFQEFFGVDIETWENTSLASFVLDTYNCEVKGGSCR